MLDRGINENFKTFLTQERDILESCKSIGMKLRFFEWIFEILRYQDIKSQKSSQDMKEYASDQSRNKKNRIAFEI